MFYVNENFAKIRKCFCNRKSKPKKGRNKPDYLLQNLLTNKRLLTVE